MPSPLAVRGPTARRTAARAPSTATPGTSSALVGGHRLLRRPRHPHGQRLGAARAASRAQTTASTQPQLAAPRRPTSARRWRTAAAPRPARSSRGQPLRPAPRRAVAELVVDEPQLGALRGDPPVAGQRQVDRSAHGVPVQQRHRGHRQRRDPLAGAPCRGRSPRRPGKPRTAVRSAPAEKIRGARAGDRDHPHRLVGRQPARPRRPAARASPATARSRPVPPRRVSTASPSRTSVSTTVGPGGSASRRAPPRAPPSDIRR